MTAVALQHADLVADCRRRDAQFGRGLLETQVAGTRFEGLQFDHRWQLLHASIVDENPSSWREFFPGCFPSSRSGQPLRRPKAEHSAMTSILSIASAVAEL